MSELSKELAEQIPQWREAASKLVAEHRETRVAAITMEQLFKGLRGVNAIVCDTSYVDPEEGLLIRGIPVLDLVDWSGEALFYLLCTGRKPDVAAESALQQELQTRREVPMYVWRTLDAMPLDAHPMTLVSMAMLAMQRESHFVQRYREGMPREDYWKATLEDALDIIARLPVIAASIYCTRLRGVARVNPDPDLGFSDNFARMLGLNDAANTFEAFMRQFVVVHSDHEGANASVLASRVVNSSLSDLYYSISGAMNCLAGPLHGLANQECLKFVMEINRHFGGELDDAALSDYIWQYLQSGKVIPGFGHAVLRDTDPRFMALYHFGQQVCPDSPAFRVVDALQRLVPPLLQKQGKAKSPWPNIDGISGSMLYHYGMKELQFYTVMFSTAQILGICAQLIINRAVYSPLIRPKSVTTRWLQGYVSDVS